MITIFHLSFLRYSKLFQIIVFPWYISQKHNCHSVVGNDRCYENRMKICCFELKNENNNNKLIMILSRPLKAKKDGWIKMNSYNQRYATVELNLQYFAFNDSINMKNNFDWTRKRVMRRFEWLLVCSQCASHREGSTHFCKLWVWPC